MCKRFDDLRRRADTHHDHFESVEQQLEDRTEWLMPMQNAIRESREAARDRLQKMDRAFEEADDEFSEELSDAVGEAEEAVMTFGYSVSKSGQLTRIYENIARLLLAVIAVIVIHTMILWRIIVWWNDNRTRYGTT